MGKKGGNNNTAKRQKHNNDKHNNDDDFDAMMLELEAKTKEAGQSKKNHQPQVLPDKIRQTSKKTKVAAPVAVQPTATQQQASNLGPIPSPMTTSGRTQPTVSENPEADLEELLAKMTPAEQQEQIAKWQKETEMWNQLTAGVIVKTLGKPAGNGNASEASTASSATPKKERGSSARGKGKEDEKAQSRLEE